MLCIALPAADPGPAAPRAGRGLQDALQSCRILFRVLQRHVQRHVTRSLHHVQSAHQHLSGKGIHHKIDQQGLLRLLLLRRLMWGVLQALLQRFRRADLQPCAARQHRSGKRWPTLQPDLERSGSARFGTSERLSMQRRR